MSDTHGNHRDPHPHESAGPPEPKTPMWLTALGAVLFLTVGLLWGLMPDSGGDGAGTPSGETADAGAQPRH